MEYAWYWLDDSGKWIEYGKKVRSICDWCQKSLVKPSLESYLGHIALQLVFHTCYWVPLHCCSVHWWINCPTKQYCYSVKAFKGLALKVGMFSRDDRHLLAEADHMGWRLLCWWCYKQQLSVGYPSVTEEQDAWSLRGLVQNGILWQRLGKHCYLHHLNARLVSNRYNFLFFSL